MKHKSYRGQSIDMELLKFQNQTAVAAGNASMNARGDILGRGGVIIKTREERLKENEMKLENPTFIPEHQSKSAAPKIDIPNSETAFFSPEEPAQPAAEETAARKPRKATKD